MINEHKLFEMFLSDNPNLVQTMLRTALRSKNNQTLETVYTILLLLMQKQSPHTALIFRTVLFLLHKTKLSSERSKFLLVQLLKYLSLSKLETLQDSEELLDALLTKVIDMLRTKDELSRILQQKLCEFGCLLSGSRWHLCLNKLTLRHFTRDQVKKLKKAGFFSSAPSTSASSRWVTPERPTQEDVFSSIHNKIFEITNTLGVPQQENFLGIVRSFIEEIVEDCRDSDYLTENNIFRKLNNLLNTLEELSRDKGALAIALSKQKSV